MLELYGDNGKENGNCYDRFRVILKTTSPFRSWVILRRLIRRGTEMGPYMWELPVRLRDYLGFWFLLAMA